MQQQWQQICTSQIGWPFVHQSLAYQNQGLISTQQIAPLTILLQIEYKNCISEETLPQTLKNMHSLQQNDKITIYILILQNLANKSILNINIVNWLKSNSAGFISFSEQTMRQMNDEQLFIQYMAYKRYYNEQAKQLFKNKQIKELLQKYTNIVKQQQFKQKLIKASQFRNTRSFGYTKQTLLIPGFDYMNYDPSQDSKKLKFLTFNYQQELQNLILSNQIQQMDVQSAQNQTKNDSQRESECEQQNLNLPSACKYISIVSIKKINKGQQLNFDYGGLSNRNLIKTYGYAVHNNPKDYLKLYISKYAKQGMIYFSSVERCTIKFNIYLNKLNLCLIQHWLKLYQKLAKSKLQILISLKGQMKFTRFPIPMQKSIIHEKNEVGNKYMQIYKEQQHRIYENQIKLITQYCETLEIKQKLND